MQSCRRGSRSAAAGDGIAVAVVDREHVIYSWSAQGGLDRLRVTGGAGLLVPGRRRPPLPGLRLAGDEPEPRPRAPAAGRGGAAPGGDAVRPGAVLRQRAALGARPAARRGDAGRPRHDAVHDRRRRRQRERRQAGALGDRPPEGRRPVPQLSRRDGGRRGAHRRPAALAGRAGGPGRRPHVRPVSLPLLRRARVRRARRARVRPRGRPRRRLRHRAPAALTWRRSCGTRDRSRSPPSSSRP